MIGNDIIDLACTKGTTDWTRHGYLQKVYSEEERAHIASSEDPFLLVWRFWSMKESAYKAHVRLTRDVGYYPSRLLCCIRDSTNGTVTIDGLCYDVESETDKQYLYSQVVSDSQRTKTDIFVLPWPNLQHDSLICKLALLRLVAGHTGLPLADLEMRKDEWQIPQIWVRGALTGLGVSISHHGRYGAVVVDMNVVA